MRRPLILALILVAAATAGAVLLTAGDDPEAAQFSTLASYLVSPGPAPARPTARIATTDAELAAVWAEWELASQGAPPRVPAGRVVIVVWAGADAGSIAVDRIGWRGRDAVVSGTTPPATGCPRLAVVGGGVSVLAVAPPPGPPASTPLGVSVEARERSGC